MKRHLKRLRAPPFWRIPKKVLTWAVAPRPGPHRKFKCIPLLVLVRDVLGLAEVGREAKSIIKAHDVLVDGKARRDPKYPVGLFDVVSIPKLRKNYRVVLTERGLGLVSIAKKEADLKLCRVEDKTHVKGRVQLNLSGGRNLLVRKDVYRTGDSILLRLSKNQVVQHLKLKPGNLALVTGGKNSGKVVRIKAVIDGKFAEPPMVEGVIGKEVIRVPRRYVFVIGRQRPVIKVG